MLQFMIPFARLGRCRDEVYDDAIGQRLWQWMEDETRHLKD